MTKQKYTVVMTFVAIVPVESNLTIAELESKLKYIWSRTNLDHVEDSYDDPELTQIEYSSFDAGSVTVAAANPIQ